MGRMIRILLADDHKLVRAGFKLLLSTQPDMEVVAEASTGEEAIAEALRCLPDVVLMDVSMPGMGGIDATREIKQKLPHVKVISLTIYDDISYCEAMFKAGASGYVLKEALPEELIETIRAVAG
jgi:DNA-binding NarL/FixJ family response regulator